MPPKPCPKCGTVLEQKERTYALREYADEQQKRTKIKNITNARSELPVSVYYCHECRYVELWA